MAARPSEEEEEQGMIVGYCDGWEEPELICCTLLEVLPSWKNRLITHQAKLSEFYAGRPKFQLVSNS